MRTDCLSGRSTPWVEEYAADAATNLGYIAAVLAQRLESQVSWDLSNLRVDGSYEMLLMM